MAADTPSNVVPLAYSLRSAARRAGCTPQEMLARIAATNSPVYVKEGQVRIPRGILTHHDWRYDTRATWTPHAPTRLTTQHHQQRSTN